MTWSYSKYDERSRMTSDHLSICISNAIHREMQSNFKPKRKEV